MDFIGEDFKILNSTSQGFVSICCDVRTQRKNTSYQRPMLNIGSVFVPGQPN